MESGDLREKVEKVGGSKKGRLTTDVTRVAPIKWATTFSEKSSPMKLEMKWCLKISF